MDSDNDGGGSHALGHAIGIGVLVGLIAFAFGKTAARVFVGAVLVLGLVAFAGVSVLMFSGAI